MLPSYLPQTFTGLLLASALGLSACGGGGGDAGGSGTPSASSGSLTVSVSTASGQAVEASSDAFYVGDPASVELKCNVTCTATPQAPQGVTVSAASARADGWSATLDFADASSALDVRLVAQDGSAVVVRLRTRPVAVGTASWTLDQRRWSRTGSTQSALGGGSGPATTGIAVNSQGGDCRSNAYACSTVSVHWYGREEGSFTIDPDFLLSPKPGRAWVNVKLTGGTAQDTIPGCTPLVQVSSDHMYNTDYRPSSGQVRVTRGSDGQFRVTTDAPLTVVRQPDSQNPSMCIRSVAAPDAPSSATVQLNAIF